MSKGGSLARIGAVYVVALVVAAAWLALGPDTSSLLLDTLLVRTVVVPALAFVLGERFWWPGRPYRGRRAGDGDGGGGLPRQVAPQRSGRQGPVGEHRAATS